MAKKYYIVIAILLCSVMFMTEAAFSEDPLYDLAISYESDAGRALYLRLDRDMSLDELLVRLGYDIDQEDMPAFLTDFLSVNETISKISIFEKGLVLKLPMRHLRKITKTPQTIEQETGSQIGEQRLASQTETQELALPADEEHFEPQTVKQEPPTRAEEQQPEKQMAERESGSLAEEQRPEPQMEEQKSGSQIMEQQSVSQAEVQELALHAEEKHPEQTAEQEPAPRTEGQQPGKQMAEQEPGSQAEEQHPETLREEQKPVPQTVQQEPELQTGAQPPASPGEMKAGFPEQISTPSVLSDVMCDARNEQKELSLFSEREKAGKFVEDLKSAGYDAYICRDTLLKTGTVYKVFMRKDREQDHPLIKASGEAGNEGEFLANLQNAASDATGERRDIFEKKHHYFHPYISITELFTDNILNTNSTRKSDFVTVISPGIWLSAPDIRDRRALINSSTISPGGFVVEDLKHESFRRFQSYLLYQADIQLFNHYSSENNTRHRIEGNLEYNPGRGCSIALQDQYLDSFDDRGTGVSTQLTRFQSNLLNLVAIYDTGHKTVFRAAYTNFLVDYNEPDSRFRRRMDNVFSTYVFYGISPKTSLFGEYDYVDIHYVDNSLLEGSEHHFFGGIRWNATAKTEGFLKAGYGIKDFDSHSGGTRDFILESGIDYHLSARGSLNFSAWRKTNETDIENLFFILTNGIRAAYTHKLSGKLSAFASLMYVNERYQGDFTFDGITGKREDRYIIAGIEFQYKFRRWLSNEFGYTYSKRDSTFSSFNYSNNTLYVRVSGAL